MRKRTRTWFVVLSLFTVLIVTASAMALSETQETGQQESTPGEAPETTRSACDATENSEASTSESSEATKDCQSGECNGCLSARQCRGQVSGTKCKVAQYKGRCIVLKTCTGGACCGCEVGGITFLDGGVMVGADGHLYTAEGALLEAPGPETVALESGNPEKDALEKTGHTVQDRIVVFRVYDSEGSPVQGAEVQVRATAPSSVTAGQRGKTVGGLFQTVLPCAGNQPTWPSQIRYSYEVWSGAGKVYRNSWWQSAGGWTCGVTKDIVVRLEPPTLE